MTHNTFITIQDLNNEPLWNGDEVIIIGNSFSFNSANIVDIKQKAFQTFILTDEDAGLYSNAFDRRKNNISYGGFNNHSINIKVFYNPVELNPVTKINNEYKKIFTPTKLFDIILNPRTLYIKDHLIYPLLSQNEKGGISEGLPDNETITSPQIYTNGIPVVLNSWNITPSVDGSEIVMDLSFIEDREI